MFIEGLASDDSALILSAKWTIFKSHLKTTKTSGKMEVTRDQDYEVSRNHVSTDYESSAAEDVESFSSSRYESAEYALLSYSRFNKIANIQALLDAKYRNEIELDLNFKGQQKQNFSWSALHLACYFGHNQVVALLFSRKQFTDELDVNIQNVSGDTPLHKATLTNRAQIVQTLLSKGASVFIKNCDGFMAKQLTTDPHILEMLEAAERVDRSRIVKDMFKTVDNGDLEKLKASVEDFSSSVEATMSKSITEAAQNSFSPSEQLSQMVDERGNTLLHLASMRGFQAICIYLLEQGLDPYRKNNLGQSCIDLASYQLRQLFTTVKPAKSKLDQLSKQKVNRFEGPLMKKVRILGWKQIYVVLENGVILLFNNRRDSMNRSRKGYKYLESATCEPDPNDLGTFTICFSDRSRASFLVTTAHLNSYTSCKYQQEQDKSLTRSSQIDLIRQKWLNAIKDHISYSTNFIRMGLKLDDEEENDAYRDGDDLTTFNHLLPIDTIKSFIQEARAHYSILERHAASLCNLMQSIATTERSNENPEDEPTFQSANITTIPNTSNSGNKLLRLIKPSRQTRLPNGDDVSTVSLNSNASSRRRNNSLTNEFVQDSWQCILFHLRLLVESTENTKVSMGQALALMEHQEELRQNRIQDQEERCRVLEDSLHALARDHHELEKSVSMSQLYHSVNSGAVRSTSISTDLNEYFDAFDDFDDEKTMTPTSMPSDEELSLEENAASRKGPTVSFGEVMARSGKSNHVNQNYLETDEDNSDDDDLRSNCSALTIATNSDFSHNIDLKQAGSPINDNRIHSSYLQSSSLRHR